MNTQLLSILAILAALLALALILRKVEARSQGSSEDLPYQMRDGLLTPAERQFYAVLQGLAAVEKLDLFAKVRLENVIKVQRGTRNHQSYRKRISSRHLDFVLCERQNTVPMLVIELNDSSHRRPDRQQRDEFVEKALKVAGVPLLQIPVQNSYSAQELSRQVRGRLGRMAHTPGVAAPNSGLMPLQGIDPIDQANLPDRTKTR